MLISDILSTPAHMEALDDEVDQKNINPVLKSDWRAVPRFHHASAFNNTGQPSVQTDDPKLPMKETRRLSEFDSMVASDNNALSPKTPAPEDFHSPPAIHHKKLVDGLNRVHTSHHWGIMSSLSYSNTPAAKYRFEMPAQLKAKESSSVSYSQLSKAERELMSNIVRKLLNDFIQSIKTYLVTAATSTESG